MIGANVKGARVGSGDGGGRGGRVGKATAGGWAYAAGSGSSILIGAGGGILKTD